MPWKMLHFSDLQRLSISEQLFAFSQANLDSAETLCTAIRAKTEVVTYAHGAVIMSLTFHALELFLKAAILRTVPTEKFGGRVGHDLTQLYNRYKGLYPKKAMQFEVPFRSEELHTSNFDKNIVEELSALNRYRERSLPEDQLHRYPTNIEGETWDAILGFEPTSFGSTIKQLQSKLTEVKAEIHNS
jgi:hypothetical protein